MQTISLSDLETRLAESVERAQAEHEQYTVTRDGHPAVVMISIDEWESLQETLFWLSQPGIHERLAEADADVQAGRLLDESQLRNTLKLPPRA